MKVRQPQNPYSYWFIGTYSLLCNNFVQPLLKHDIALLTTICVATLDCNFVSLFVWHRKLWLAGGTQQTYSMVEKNMWKAIFLTIFFMTESTVQNIILATTIIKPHCPKLLLTSFYVVHCCLSSLCCRGSYVWKRPTWDLIWVVRLKGTGLRFEWPLKPPMDVVWIWHE